MANKKTEPAEELKWSKSRIVKCERYIRYQDFLTGNLEDKEYTFTEVDAILEKYFEKVR